MLVWQTPFSEFEKYDMIGFFRTSQWCSRWWIICIIFLGDGY